MAFLVVRGHDLNRLINATYSEKIFYIHAKNKYIEEENKKMKALGGGE